ncbi:hypothetical protein [Acinetobacter guillouiae]|uniref:hypothetical protein n=1 Tax=Acinetobacter guillouiae TaxID=106649 RepID=UPI003AF97D35
MTTINNLTIEQMREIVNGPPEGKSFISGKVMPADGFDVKHGKYVMCDGVYKFHWCNGWDIHSYAWHDFVLNVIDLNNLRTAIVENDAFKAGDLVVSTLDGQEFWMNCICKIEAFHKKMAITSCGGHSIHHYEFRHATPEEIKAGHRIDGTTDHVTDIRNHVSPSTIVTDLHVNETDKLNRLGV